MQISNGSIPCIENHSDQFSFPEKNVGFSPKNQSDSKTELKSVDSIGIAPNPCIRPENSSSATCENQNKEAKSKYTETQKNQSKFQRSNPRSSQRSHDSSRSIFWPRVNNNNSENPKDIKSGFELSNDVHSASPVATSQSLKRDKNKSRALVHKQSSILKTATANDGQKKEGRKVCKRVSFAEPEKMRRKSSDRLAGNASPYFSIRKVKVDRSKDEEVANEHMSEQSHISAPLTQPIDEDKINQANGGSMSGECRSSEKIPEIVSEYPNRQNLNLRNRFLPTCSPFSNITCGSTSQVHIQPQRTPLKFDDKPRNLDSIVKPTPIQHISRNPSRQNGDKMLTRNQRNRNNVSTYLEQNGGNSSSKPKGNETKGIAKDGNASNPKSPFRKSTNKNNCNSTKKEEEGRGFTDDMPNEGDANSSDNKVINFTVLLILG